MDTQELEHKAYRDHYADGLVDLFIGLSIAWIGIAWLWIEPLAGLAGVFPAVLIPSVKPLRERVVEPRAGYVRWTAPRRRWERRQLLVMVGLGCAALLLGIGAFIAASGSSGGMHWVAGMPALLLAVPAVVLAAASGIRRLWAYGFILASCAAVAILSRSNPGAPLLVAGALITATGVILLVRFLAEHPVRSAS